MSHTKTPRTRLSSGVFSLSALPPGKLTPQTLWRLREVAPGFVVPAISFQKLRIDYKRNPLSVCRWVNPTNNLLVHKFVMSSPLPASLQPHRGTRLVPICCSLLGLAGACWRSCKLNAKSGIEYVSSKGVSVADDEQLEQLRFMLARAYEKRQPFVFRLIHAVKERMGAHIQKKPIIESLQTERNEDAA